ncbi:BRO1-like domain-containing protein [Rhodocollybia butyracea]|uniref:BRO1-like domain-containing protein n=1 Tax=Rhodocollybia butyracea TaxID=206335 RepID=A0A9P5PNM5_9AGAR|nr:BRO1-like domain-containing protein [Rhodocollybia butyracea]
MSNLLAVPFKKTYQVDVAGAARNYLLENGETHPDAVKKDLQQWQEMRQKIVGLQTHSNRINECLSYHAQLTSILAKFPVDIGLDIAYAPAFSPSVVPITLRNLMFEQAGVVFNLGSLYTQLAASEDRSNVDGIKRAAAYYQNASGTFSYLGKAVLPNFSVPLGQEDSPTDLSDSFIQALEYLSLAQAQECFWQKAKLDNLKNGLVAKLAAATMHFYKKSITSILEASPPIKHVFPSEWLAHMEAKQYHFEAVAQYRKSREELENSRYGFEIAYLTQAHAAVKKGHDIARRGKVLAAVQSDIQSFLDTVKKDLNRAERDNDLIYHHDVPTGSSLPLIQQAAVAQATVPKELANPNILVPSQAMLFSELMGWGAREAINIYNDRKKNLIQEELLGPAKESKNAAEQLLQRLSLPASLEALQRPVGLPPSFLKKAEEVRMENGPAKIEATIEDLYRLSRQNHKILNEAMDILDQEASEDESTRDSIHIDRLPSHEANAHLVDKERRYRTILEQAATGDETIRTKWDQWERNITELTWDESDLEASIPSSTKQTQSGETEKHARSLRILLESLNDLYSDRENLIKRAESLAEADDIQPRIVKAASGFERLAEMHPAMFEDVSDDELAKYDKFIQWMKKLDVKQEEILESIKVSENESYLQSRKESETVKEREQALLSLDLSYHKYKEIIHNLEEGINFYNGLITILLQFKEACHQWCTERKQEIHSLSRSMRSLNIGGESDSSRLDRDPPSQKKILVTDLNSSDWESVPFGTVPGRKA